MAFKSRIIVPNANNHRQKTVNIVTSTAGYQKGQIGTFREDTNCETVQDSGGTVKGLPTICVPGYSGGGGGGGGDLPVLPDGFAFVVSRDSDYVLDIDGKYVVGRI